MLATNAEFSLHALYFLALFYLYDLPGKEVVLRPLPPLRTGRESFPFIRLKPMQSPARAEPVHAMQIASP